MENENYKRINVEANLQDPESVLHFYRKLIRLKKPTDQLNDGDWYFDADATYAALAQKMGVSVEELIAFTDSVFYNAIAEYDPDSGLLILRDANSSDPNDEMAFKTY